MINVELDENSIKFLMEGLEALNEKQGTSTQMSANIIGLKGYLKRKLTPVEVPNAKACEETETTEEKVAVDD